MRDSVWGRQRAHTPELARLGSSPSSAPCCVVLDKLHSFSEPCFFTSGSRNGNRIIYQGASFCGLSELDLEWCLVCSTCHRAAIILDLRRTAPGSMGPARTTSLTRLAPGPWPSYHTSGLSYLVCKIRARWGSPYSVARRGTWPWQVCRAPASSVWVLDFGQEKCHNVNPGDKGRTFMKAGTVKPERA